MIDSGVPHTRKVGDRVTLNTPILRSLHGRTGTIARLTRANAENVPAYLVMLDGNNTTIGPLYESEVTTP